MHGRERSVRVQRERCPYCHDPVTPADAKRSCEACMAWHHRACWVEHGACSACGEAQREPVLPERLRCLEAECESPRTTDVWRLLVRDDLPALCDRHAAESMRELARQSIYALVVFGLFTLGGLAFVIANPQFFPDSLSLPAACGLTTAVVWALRWGYRANARYLDPEPDGSDPPARDTGKG